ncbi:hypothetical protein PtA15_11A651 [Puccinia triticina]|uniref:Uncharacterized protein n=1 Tax=Puccinia triticina TaxID=208348 RepID=A0ABY7CXC8_9BASI|nr:uncharacterized protein PtA15_11A651 [Puccinia triticina]WAQ89959.1 hypothetical protein PtA15_11A651 [Puccinia triticina]
MLVVSPNQARSRIARPGDPRRNTRCPKLPPLSTANVADYHRNVAAVRKGEARQLTTALDKTDSIRELRLQCIAKSTQFKSSTTTLRENKRAGTTALNLFRAVGQMLDSLMPRVSTKLFRRTALAPQDPGEYLFIELVPDN